MKSVEVRLVGRFKLTGKVAGNHQHLLYTASHTQNDSTYILKGQQAKNKPQVHFLSILQEGKILQTMQGGIGIPHMQWCGQEQDYNFIVLEELDRSLQVMLQKCDRKFTFKTVLMLGIELISILQYFHFKNFIHNNINPHHILLGNGSKFGKFYLIDYSNASRYRDAQTLEHIEEGTSKKNQKRNINILFTSANCHRGFSTSRKDDLISLLYMMVYLLNGSLPWSPIFDSKRPLQQKSKQILQLKQTIQPSKIFAEYPDLMMLYQYTASLKFDQKPRQRMEKQGLLEDGVYDWMLLVEDYSTNLEQFDLNFEIIPNEQEFLRHLTQEMKNKEKTQLEAMEKKKIENTNTKIKHQKQKECIIF